MTGEGQTSAEYLSLVGCKQQPKVSGHCEFGRRAYIPRVRELVRRNLRFFLLSAAVALILRVVFIIYFPAVVNDSFVYGDIAKNWLQHGTYGLSGPVAISPTYMRLPGYPAFLALLFAIFGVEHYRAVLVVQMFIDVGTCFLCASIGLRLFGDKPAKIAFLLAAVCPFLADYSAAALTETLEVFFTALALDSALRALEMRTTQWWSVCGLACAAATCLRPDGAMLPFVIVLYLGWQALRRGSLLSRGQALRFAGVVAILAVLPLVPWALRNWRVFHRFQPLAPRYANEEGEFVPMGFNRWVKTWMADYASVEEIYWVVPGATIDPQKLPSRAFDDPQQYAETVRVIDEYNAVLHVSPALDREFADLARKRIQQHPLRYYIGLPILRVMDMWLRPRTEMLPCDTRWWEFNDEPRWSALAVGLGVIGLFYVLAAVAGWLQHPFIPGSGLLLAFVVLRSAFLGTLENPEPRYTLEMYPIVIVFAAAALAGRSKN